MSVSCVLPPFWKIIIFLYHTSDKFKGTLVYFDANEKPSVCKGVSDHQFKISDSDDKAMSGYLCFFVRGFRQC